MIIQILIVVNVILIRSRADDNNIHKVNLRFISNNQSVEKEKNVNGRDRRAWRYEGIDIPAEPQSHNNSSLVNSDEEDDDTTIITQPPQKVETGLLRKYNANETTMISEHPFLAAILMNGEFWCAGVIVDNDKILTAAHCLQLQYKQRFFHEYMKMLSIRVGSSNATSGGEVLQVTELFFHPNYVPETLQFNLAMLRVHKNMTFHDKVQKIKYSTKSNVQADRNVTFLGWGAIKDLKLPEDKLLLQKIELPIYNIMDCQEIYGSELVTMKNFCAGFITVVENVCNHDGGGPAVVDNQLMGVLSFSYNRCDVLDKPAVFSTVGTMSPWLQEVITGK